MLFLGSYAIEQFECRMASPRCEHCALCLEAKLVHQGSDDTGIAALQQAPARLFDLCPDLLEEMYLYWLLGGCLACSSAISRID